MPPGLLGPVPLDDSRSLDEIDRASFHAGPSPQDHPAVVVTLRPGGCTHAAPATRIDLSGEWQLAEGARYTEEDIVPQSQRRLGWYYDHGNRHVAEWEDALPAQVPGSVHAALVASGKIPDPYHAKNDVHAKAKSELPWWYRKRFPRPAGDGPFELVFEGVCNRCFIWLNGHELAEHHGMFAAITVEVSALLEDDNHLVVLLDPIPETHDMFLWANNSWAHTAVFNNCYGWHYSQIPALGIWQPVHLDALPVVGIEAPFISTVDRQQGLMHFATTLRGRGVGIRGLLRLSIAAENFADEERHIELAVDEAGEEHEVHLRFRIPDPQLWWPVDMGRPNLYRFTVSFAPEQGGGDCTSGTFGIRTIEMAPQAEGIRSDRYNWTFVVNGQRMFVKGTGWCTNDTLMDFSRERYERFISMAADEHCQMLRAWGSGMPETFDFYDLCDRYGLMVMQEWPTAWNSHRQTLQPFAVLEETVGHNTRLRRNHPSLVMWGAGNESGHPFGRAIDEMGRLAIELDGTRPFHRGEPYGGSKHGYPAYWGRQDLDSHCTMEATFWGEFGMACMPNYESVQRYLPDGEKNAWPAPANGSFNHHTPIFNTMRCRERLDRASLVFLADEHTMADYCLASQLSQVDCLRHTLERARARWPDCTGALLYKLNDNFPAASWATVDWYGAPKIGHYFVRDAFAPLHVCLTLDTLHFAGEALSAPVTLLDDCDALAGRKWQVQVRVYDDSLSEVTRFAHSDSGGIEAPLRCGMLELAAEQTDSAPLLLVTEVLVDGSLADRSFLWCNYKRNRGCLFRLPRTELALTTAAGAATITNTGRMPAIGAAVLQPGRLDTFRADNNFVWLDPGESITIAVSDTQGLEASAWNADRREVTP